MFYSTALSKTNCIHESALRTVYSDYKSSFNELLLRFLKKKYLHGLSPTTLGEVFKVNETIPYGLRMRSKLFARNLKTVRFGTETIYFLSPKIWALKPQNIKDSSSFCFRKGI